MEVQIRGVSKAHANGVLPEADDHGDGVVVDHLRTVSQYDD